MLPHGRSAISLDGCGVKRKIKMNKPDLMDMFFSELQPQRMTMEDFFSVFADMEAEEFIGIFTDLLERWGRGAAHIAFDMIRNAPEERDRVTKLVRLASRCARLQKVFDALKEEEYRMIEPSARATEHDVREAYSLVRRYQERKGDA
jgi:hypothetical protein